MAATLTTHLPLTRSGRTLFIASCVLGVCALLQMALLGWHLLRGGRRGAAAAATADGGVVIHFSETTEPTTSSLDVPFSKNPIFAESATAPSSAALTRPEPAVRSAAPGIDRPTPAPPVRYPVSDLLEQARLLRQNQDANGALAKLREAQSAEPANPQIIAELGMTYESMQLQDQAFEQWHRLFNMGDAVGVYYYLADSKLHSAPGSAPAIGAAARPAPGGAAPDAAGFQDNSMLKITSIHPEELLDPASEKKLSLKIVVKNRPGTAIDPKKVKIETYFYDLVDGRDVVQTDAQTGFAWLTGPVNWEDDESEVLETTYDRAKPAPAAPPSATPEDTRRGRKGKGRPADAPADAPPPAPVRDRAYLGYIVRLYYDRQLQDVQADPLRLLQQFPPPLTLPEN